MTLFNAEAKCPKCGGDDIHAAWVKAGIHRWDADCLLDGEHIHRSCRRCWFGWVEAPLDLPPAPPRPLLRPGSPPMADPTWTDREAQLLAQRAILLGTVEHLKADVARLTREREEAANEAARLGESVAQLQAQILHGDAICPTCQGFGRMGTGHPDSTGEAEEIGPCLDCDGGFIPDAGAKLLAAESALAASERREAEARAVIRNLLNVWPEPVDAALTTAETKALAAARALGAEGGGDHGAR